MKRFPTADELVGHAPFRAIILVDEVGNGLIDSKSVWDLVGRARAVRR